jgi:hypothetical protein
LDMGPRHQPPPAPETTTFAASAAVGRADRNEQPIRAFGNCQPRQRKPHSQGPAHLKKGHPDATGILQKPILAQRAKLKALNLVVVGSCPTVVFWGKCGVSTSLSAHPHGTTQQTQVFAALRVSTQKR